jgi:hypothetical protein
VHVAVTFPGGVQEFSGVLTIERAEIEPATEDVVRFGAPVRVPPIEYRGLGLETASLVFKAPSFRGAYCVAFRDDTGAEPAGLDELPIAFKDEQELRDH